MATTRVATPGTHWVPTHANTTRHHHTQTAPRRINNQSISCSMSRLCAFSPTRCVLFLPPALQRGIAVCSARSEPAIVESPLSRQRVAGVMSDDAATERAIFRRACAVLSELQDDLAWSDVAPKFKGQAKRWQNSLDQTARQGKCLRTSLLTPITRAVP